MMMTIVARPYCHMACPIIIVGGWVMVSCKIEWYFLLINSTSQIYINIIWEILKYFVINQWVITLNTIIIPCGMLMSFSIIEWIMWLLHIVKDVKMKDHFIHPSRHPSVLSWFVYFDRVEKTVEYKRGWCLHIINNLYLPHVDGVECAK